MHRTRIKICGLTRPEDAAFAVAAGADAIGVVFAPSKRQVTVEQAMNVFAEVPPPVARVGVFVDADPEFVEKAALSCGLSAVQYHGDESPDACARAPRPAIKAIKVGTEFDTESFEPYRGRVAALLLDKLSTRNAGGTGETFSWHLITEVPGWAHLFLAGGLRPENVAEGIRAIRPWAVDVSSGVESEPGVKDHARITAFIEQVRDADRAIAAGGVVEGTPSAEIGVAGRRSPESPESSESPASSTRRSST